MMLIYATARPQHSPESRHLHRRCFTQSIAVRYQAEASEFEIST